MREFVCIVCPNGCRLQAETLADGTVRVQGNTCPRGEAFGIAELTNPTRSLTTTVRTDFPAMPMLPVRTAGELPKERLFEAMAALNAYTQTTPVRCGDIVLPDLLGTGCNVIATDDWTPWATEVQ